jgi:hypothetical protein
MSGKSAPTTTSIAGTIGDATPPMAVRKPPTGAPSPGFCPERPGAGVWQACREIGPVRCLP